MNQDLKRVIGKQPRWGMKQRKDCKGGCLQDDPVHCKRMAWVPGRGHVHIRSHDSIEEARYCDQLMLMKKAGEIRTYKAQVRYDLTDILGNSCGWMRVDFVVTRADGRIQIHEYKGKVFGTLMEYKTKKALFTWNYPDVEHVTVNKNDIVF